MIIGGKNTRLLSRNHGRTKFGIFVSPSIDIYWDTRALQHSENQYQKPKWSLVSVYLGINVITWHSYKHLLLTISKSGSNPSCGTKYIYFSDLQQVKHWCLICTNRSEKNFLFVSFIFIIQTCTLMNQFINSRTFKKA